MKTKIILASGSPRRKELLHQVGIDFEVVISEADESLPENIHPKEAVKILSLRKASAVQPLCEKDCTIIGADTVVAIDGKILGKPIDETDAVQMLEALSGKTHTVYTGVAILHNEETYNFYVESQVTFFELSSDEITEYVKSGEPLDKAGAYGIQGLGASLVEKINGDYFNIVGLPVSKVLRCLKDNHLI